MMGLVRIRDDDEEETFLSGRLDGTVVVELTDSENPRVMFSPDTPADSADAGGERSPAVDSGRRAPTAWWTLWVPTALAALSLGIHVLVSTGAAGLAPLRTVLFGATYLASVYGVVVLYSDVELVREAGDAWTPSFWRYVGPATLVVAGLSVATGVLPAPPVTDVAYYAGVLVASVFLSPVVAGPVYLLHRARHVGLER